MVADGSHFVVVLKRPQGEGEVTSLFWIIPNILLPKAECLEYVPSIPESEKRLNRTDIRGFSVYSFSGIKAIGRTPNQPKSRKITRNHKNNAKSRKSREILLRRQIQRCTYRRKSNIGPCLTKISCAVQALWNLFI